MNWKYPNGIATDWWRVVLTYLFLVALVAAVGFYLWPNPESRRPARPVHIDFDALNTYYEVEFGSRGTGTYIYGFPDWESCVSSSGGYVINEHADGSVQCRFYYSGP